MKYIQLTYKHTHHYLIAKVSDNFVMPSLNLPYEWLPDLIEVISYDHYDRKFYKHIYNEENDKLFLYQNRMILETHHINELKYINRKTYYQLSKPNCEYISKALNINKYINQILKNINLNKK